MKPRVELIAATPDPDRVIQIIWKVSKTNTPVSLDPNQEIEDPELIYKLVKEDVPVLRHLKLTFYIEDMSISFREQLVRTLYDDYWIQSGRVTDWSNLQVEVPRIIKENEELNDRYMLIVRAIKGFIDLAKEENIPPESYRDIIPVGALHRGIWTTNVQSLMQRFKKRTCWIAQADKWFPVLMQVASILREYHNGLASHILPPCKNEHWEYLGCPFKNTMMDRINGTDPLAPCPIFLYNELNTQHDEIRRVINDNYSHVAKLERMWSRDILTGLPVVSG